MSLVTEEFGLGPGVEASEIVTNMLGVQGLEASTGIDGAGNGASELILPNFAARFSSQC